MGGITHSMGSRAIDHLWDEGSNLSFPLELLREYYVPLVRSLSLSVCVFVCEANV